MSHNGVPTQDISDTVVHKSAHVTEAVYRHAIIPAISGVTVMDWSSKPKTLQATEASAAATPRSRSHLICEQGYEESWAVLDLNQ